MTDNISHRFFEVSYPSLFLAREFCLSDAGIIDSALHRIFTKFAWLHAVNDRPNLSAAYDNARGHIDDCMALFDRYATEYSLSETQEDTALAAWLCQNCIDPTDPDEWEEIDPDALAILAFMEHDHTVFPLLSDGKDDPALALNIGLQVWSTLSFRTHNYKSPGRWHASFFCDPEADWRYANTILRDENVIETALTGDCRTKAKELIDTLRGRMRHFHLV